MNNILSFGEVLADIFPSGAKAGGAPANFAWYCSQLEANAEIVSAIGADETRRFISDVFKEAGISSKYIQISKSFPTGSVQIKLDKNSVPEYVFLKDTAYDNIEFTPVIKEFAQSVDLIYFGTLAQRSAKSAETIQKILAAGKNAVKAYDINLRQNYYSKEIIENSLLNANILKISLEELPVCAKALNLQYVSEDICIQLLKKFNLDIVALTKGSLGSTIFTKDRKYHSAGIPVKAVDTVGAGDAFAAVLCMGFLQKADFEIIGKMANAVASYVCTQPGAMAKLPRGLWKK